VHELGNNHRRRHADTHAQIPDEARYLRRAVRPETRARAGFPR
jgi:hypothetical protein